MAAFKTCLIRLLDGVAICIFLKKRATDLIVGYKYTSSICPNVSLDFVSLGIWVFVDCQKIRYNVRLVNVCVFGRGIKQALSY